MTKSIINPVRSEIIKEQRQTHDTRIHLFKKIEKLIKKPLITFYTSFLYPVSIEDADATMLGDILSKINLKQDFALMINSPGGYGVSAERIIRTCRSYSTTGEYSAIVPDKAKSAATMICFGANQIYMGPTSELGAIDPQVVFSENGKTKRYSVYDLVKSYEELFDKSEKTTGHLEPYLQQLSRFDHRDIREFNRQMDLSEDIAIKTLKQCMLNGLTKNDIKKKIKIFLTPEKTKTHARPIYFEEAKKCGLKIKEIKAKDKLWELLGNLHIRTEHCVNSEMAKCVESKDYHFYMPPPKKSQ